MSSQENLKRTYNFGDNIINEKIIKIEKEKKEKEKANGGTALFFNYIDGCKNDVINLRERLENLGGWKCMEVKVNEMKDFRKEQREIIKISSGIMMVFFFGYGYEDQIFLGTSTKESVSYLVFFEKLNEFQNKNKDNQVIVFTNTCFKKPVDHTYEYVELEKFPKRIYHFCTEINGTCEKEGSLVTHILLNHMKEKDLPFEKMANELSGKINAAHQWNEDKYYSYWLCHGVIESVIVPSLCKK